MASAYAERRLENIRRNEALLQELGLDRPIIPVPPKAAKPPSTNRPSKRRKITEERAPTRSSARIASSVESRPQYDEDASSSEESEDQSDARIGKTKARQKGKPERRNTATTITDTTPRSTAPRRDVAAIQAGWTSWTPSASAPTRDADGTFHFASHADFTPNKSPEEVLREGAFGGSYFRPLRSAALGVTVRDDWRELPAAWTAGLDAGRVLANPEYDAAVNKFGVACGQSIEEWEKAGWIAHEHDVRGWFQWFCRFWMGRRTEDGEDERQIARWKRCVGENGRWRRTLLKRYVVAACGACLTMMRTRSGREAEMLVLWCIRPAITGPTRSGRRRWIVFGLK